MTGCFQVATSWMVKTCCAASASVLRSAYTSFATHVPFSDLTHLLGMYLAGKMARQHPAAFALQGAVGELERRASSIHAYGPKRQVGHVPVVFFHPSPLPCFALSLHPRQFSFLAVGLKFGSLFGMAQSGKGWLFDVADSRPDGVLVRPELHQTPSCRTFAMGCKLGASRKRNACMQELRKPLQALIVDCDRVAKEEEKAMKPPNSWKRFAEGSAKCEIAIVHSIARLGCQDHMVEIYSWEGKSNTAEKYWC
eukprot:s575_g3.t1